MTVIRRTGVMAAGTSLALGAILTGQAFYTVRRRDLPSVVGTDATGIEAGRTASAVPSTLRLAAIGDSTLTGPGIGDNRQIWIRQVARAMADRAGQPVAVSSFAVGGSRIRDVLESQIDQVLAAAPDVVVVAVGSNDALRLTPLAQVEREFAQLLERLVGRVPSVVVGGVGDLGGIARVPFPLSCAVRSRGRAVNRIIRSAVAQSDAHYIDVSTVDRAFRRGGTMVFAADLFHPNEYGHALWAGAATPVVLHATRSVTPR